LAWIILLVLTIIAALWIWLATEMYSLMPHTFAWEMLLRTYGSSFSLNCPESGLATVNQWPPVEDCAPISHSIPCVPIISLMILTITMACGFVCLLPVSLTTLDAAASGVRVSLTWQICFLVISLIVVSYFYNEDSGSLRPAMLASLESSKSEVSEMWNVTQTESQCCGIDSYKDWNFAEGLYPLSCCEDTMQNTSTCTSDQVWEVGCLRQEEITVEIYGALNFFLLCFQCMANIYLCYLIEGLRTVWMTTSMDGEREVIELGVPLLR